MLLNPILAKRIDSKLASIQKQRPLSRAALLKLKEQFAIELTYNSNAIEGNRLTLKETYWVIAEGLTIKGKPLKDHLEAIDHHEAIQFLYQWVGQKRTHRLSEHVIRSLHQLVVQKSDALSAGSYRSGNVLITGSSHVPVTAQEVPPLMNGFFSSIKAKARKMHTVELAAFAHHQLVFIHPFADGNGRTARLLMNLILLQRGYPLVVILKNDRKKYYVTLHQADKGRLEPLVRLIGQSVERSLNLYLKMLAPETWEWEFYR